ncbi:MAG TPA: hypothetical protein VK572_14530 [Burkholderiales bacterium]|jgi:hypothetical protein|nr:hypothetical protein [Burkholderiales bacterium]
MNEDLTWEVGYEAAGRESREKALAKAWFYWKKDGQVVRSAEFTQSELEAECERLCEAGGDITQFARALLALSTEQAEGENVVFDRVDRRRLA